MLLVSPPTRQAGIIAKSITSNRESLQVSGQQDEQRERIFILISGFSFADIWILPQFLGTTQNQSDACINCRSLSHDNMHALESNYLKGTTCKHLH
jgi:hypothetical protein